MPNFLPLSDFLDRTVDPCSAETFAQWKAAGAEVCATSRWTLPSGETEWRRCFVLDYIEKTDRYLIQWVCNSKTKYVGRLNLIFDAENRRVYESSVHQARQTRSIVESELRYAYRVQSMLVPEGLRLPAATAKRIFCLLYTSPSPRDGLLSRMPSSA